MNAVKTGVLADATPLIIPVGNMDCPMTASLTSAAGGRLIEFSATGGAANSFYSPTVTNTNAAMIAISIMAPITRIRVTGQAGDVYRVQ